MIKFGFLPLFSLFLDRPFFSVVWSTQLQGPWSYLDFLVLLQCQWCKLRPGDVSRVAYPVSYLVIKYSSSGDFWAAFGSPCQYFDIFMVTQVVFDLFGFWLLGFLLGCKGFFPQSSVYDLNLLYGSLNPLLLILSAGNIKSRIFLTLCIKLLQIAGFHHQTCLRSSFSGPTILILWGLSHKCFYLSL